MMYDAFVCHASEDKESVVRPLAESLRTHHVEVWYDEFTLTVGDSLRRSIDRGLVQSRFGIVILSPSFFAKNWPQYELDGLLDRELYAGTKVILPVWHQVDHEAVARYSPALAGRMATATANGLLGVVNDLLRVIRPEGSPLVIARDLVIDAGLTPPVVTDPYWIEVIEASNRVPGWGAVVPEESGWDRWSFPLPPRDGQDAFGWGHRLAWTAMQLDWVRAADDRHISVTTPPYEVVAFIESQPGLLEACTLMPDIAAEYAPQLTIVGNEGPLADVFEREYRQSLATHIARRSGGDRGGSALTTDDRAPRCGEIWAFRDPQLGNYETVYLAQGYFHSDLSGPTVALFDDGDHLFWLLSSASDWLPRNLHLALLDGMKASHRRWQWGPYLGEKPIDDYPKWPSFGALADALVRRGKRLQVKWNEEIEADVIARAFIAKDRLGLPEDDRELMQRFRDAECIQRAIGRERELSRRRAGPPRQAAKTKRPPRGAA